MSRRGAPALLLAALLVAGVLAGCGGGASKATATTSRAATSAARSSTSAVATTPPKPKPKPKLYPPYPVLTPAASIASSSLFFCIQVIVKIAAIMAITPQSRS